jgi:hypothetical protein
MKRTVYDCDSCYDKDIEPGSLIEILGVMRLPGDISIPLAIHFHDDCLPPELMQIAQEALGNI